MNSERLAQPSCPAAHPQQKGPFDSRSHTSPPSHPLTKTHCWHGWHTCHLLENLRVPLPVLIAGPIVCLCCRGTRLLYGYVPMCTRHLIVSKQRCDSSQNLNQHRQSVHLQVLGSGVAGIRLQSPHALGSHWRPSPNMGMPWGAIYASWPAPQAAWAVRRNKGQQQRCPATHLQRCPRSPILCPPAPPCPNGLPPAAEC